MLVHRVSHRTWERQIKYISRIMAVVSIDAFSEAYSSKRDAGLSDKRLAIVTIRVAPDAVHLATSAQQRTMFRLSYQLVAANHSHHTQRLNTMASWMESCIGWPITLVAKDNIWDEIGVQVGHRVSGSLRVLLHKILPRSLRLGVLRRPAATIARIRLITVTINVHVCELVSCAVEVDYAGFGVLAVSECCRTLEPFIDTE